MINPVIIGDATLYLGDCLEILPTLEKGSIGAVVTDPPYDMGIERVPLGGAVGKFGRFSESRSVGLKWPVNHAWINLVAEIAPKHWVVFSGQKELGDVLVSIQQFAKLQNVFTWRKSNAPQMTRPVPRMDTEFAIWARSDDSSCERMGEFRSSVIDCPMAYAGIGGGERIRLHKNGPAAHPTQKPLGVITPFIDRLRQNNIADPFMGSGTTGVSCVQTGRKFIGIEIDPGYFEIACRRIEAAQRQCRIDFSETA